MADTDLYDADIVAWSEQQAGALRCRAANEIDWDNVAEEIGDMGNNVVHTAASHLVQALRMISRPRRGPPRAIDRLYQRALRRLPETEDGVPPLPCRQLVR